MCPEKTCKLISCISYCNETQHKTEKKCLSAFICNGFLKSGLMYAVPVFVGITVPLNKMPHWGTWLLPCCRRAFCVIAHLFDETTLLSTITVLPLIRRNYAHLPHCPLGINFVPCRLAGGCQQHTVHNIGNQGALEKEVAWIDLNSNWFKKLTVVSQSQRSHIIKKRPKLLCGQFKEKRGRKK